MKLKFIPVLFLFFYSSQAQQVTLGTGTKRMVPSYFAGVNGNLGTNDMPWNNQNLLSAFIGSGANTIRYPAGTIANTWDWDRGWIDPTVPDSLLINWVVTEKWKTFNVQYTVEHFAKAIKASGAEPVYVLNMLSKDLEHSLRGLRRAKAAGIPVRHVELGNELYFNLPLETKRFPTPEDYGRTCYDWISAIKKEFPEAKCAVVSWEVVRSERHREWTERVLKYATNADAVIFHVYTPFGIDGARERANNQAGEEGLTEKNITSKDPKERQLQELALLNEPRAWNRMLQTGFRVAERHKHMRVPSNKEIWATEFNVRADSSAIKGTWANTLFITTFYLTFLKNPQVTITHFHNIQGPAFGALNNNRAGFRHVLNQNITSEPWTLTAGGFAMKFFADFSKQGGQATELVFNNNPAISVNDTSSVKALHGWTISGKKGSQAIVINYSGNAVTVNAGTLLNKWKYTSWSAQLQQYITGESSMTQSSGRATETITLPPYSITVLKK